MTVQEAKIIVEGFLGSDEKINKALEIAIQALEEVEQYRAFKEIFERNFSDEALKLLSDKEEFTKWLERGKWTVKRCDELNREVQQYRALGTVKEIRIREASNVQLSKAYLSNLSELREYQALGTVEELKEAKEKQIPKKPIEDNTSYSGYKCPACNSNVYQLRSHNICKTPHCIFCGQSLDWEEGVTNADS